MSWLEELQDLSGKGWWSNIDIKPVDSRDPRLGWLLTDKGQEFGQVLATLVQADANTAYAVSIDILKSKRSKGSAASAVRLLTKEADNEEVGIWEVRLHTSTGDFRTSWNRPPGIFGRVTERADYWRVEQMCLVDDIPASVRVSLVPAIGPSPEEPYDFGATGSMVVRNISIERISLEEGARRSAAWKP